MGEGKNISKIRTLRFGNGYGFFEVTQAEYEELEREVIARHFCDATTLMDRIIAELLLNAR